MLYIKLQCYINISKQQYTFNSLSLVFENTATVESYNVLHQ